MGRQFFTRFHVAKADVAFERQITLVRVEHVKQQNLVIRVSQVIEPVHDARQVVEQVADHHDHAAVPRKLGRLMQRPSGIGNGPRVRGADQPQDFIELVRFGLGRQAGDDRIGKQRDSDGVLLLEGQMGERRR